MITFEKSHALLTKAILTAFKDYAENQSLTPSNPAIVRDGEAFYYGSAIHPHDVMVWDLSEGLKSWTPNTDDDLASNAYECAYIHLICGWE